MRRPYGAKWPTEADSTHASSLRSPKANEGDMAQACRPYGPQWPVGAESTHASSLCFLFFDGQRKRKRTWRIRAAPTVFGGPWGQPVGRNEMALSGLSSLVGG